MYYDRNGLVTKGGPGSGPRFQGNHAQMNTGNGTSIHAHVRTSETGQHPLTITSRGKDGSKTLHESTHMSLADAKSQGEKRLAGLADKLIASRIQNPYR